MHLTEGAHLGGDSSVNNLVLGVSLRGFSLTTPLRDFNPGLLCAGHSAWVPLCLSGLRMDSLWRTWAAGSLVGSHFEGPSVVFLRWDLSVLSSPSWFFQSAVPSPNGNRLLLLLSRFSCV